MEESFFNPKLDRLIGYDDQFASLKSVIQHAIVDGESGNVLVYGGRGMGKSSLVNYCLDQTECVAQCKILRLNGLIHGNDLSTIRYIGRCLSVSAGSDILETLRIYKDNRAKANLIIVIDEFDVFCRKNQLLLYNFFDLVQYEAHILVIGLTARYDCIELLEKRVKSRMNHKIINLGAPYQNLGEYLKFAEKLLPPTIKINESIQKQLEIQYSKSYSIYALKLCLLQAISIESSAFHSKQAGKFKSNVSNNSDLKVQLFTCLSQLEICVLLLCAKIVYRKEQEHLNLGGILALKQEIPSQFSVNKRLVYTAVGTLTDYDLISIDNQGNNRNSGNQLHLTDWTPLHLNISENQIMEALKQMDSQLTHGVKNLLSIQA